MKVEQRDVHQLIRHISVDERPRERLARAGSAALSLRELIALIIGHGPRGKGCLGIADVFIRAICEGDDDDQRLQRLLDWLLQDPKQKRHLPQTGAASQARISASLEVARRLLIEFAQREPLSKPVVIKMNHAIRDALKAIPRDERISSEEWLGIVPWQKNGQVGMLEVVSRGSATDVAIDLGYLAKRLILANVQAFVLFHNHPAGGLVPSRADINLTKRVREAAELLGVTLLGHWIVTRHGQVEVH